MRLNKVTNDYLTGVRVLILPILILSFVGCGLTWIKLRVSPNRYNVEHPPLS